MNILLPGIIIGCLLIGISIGFSFGILLGYHQRLDEEYDKTLSEETD